MKFGMDACINILKKIREKLAGNLQTPPTKFWHHKNLRRKIVVKKKSGRTYPLFVCNFKICSERQVMHLVAISHVHSLKKLNIYQYRGSLVSNRQAKYSITQKDFSTSFDNLILNKAFFFICRLALYINFTSPCLTVAARIS